MQVDALNGNSTIEQPQMKAEDFYNPARQTKIGVEGAYIPPVERKPKTDLDKTRSKNPSNELIKPAQEFAKSVTKTGSKMPEFKTYHKAVNNLINRNR